MGEWAQSLAGFRPEELERGLAEMRNRKFIPTLGEFRVACRPALDPEAAWYEAEEGLKQRELGHRGEWTHPAIWRAACDMSLNIRSGEYARHRARWAAHLRRELARGWGDGVPPVPPRLSMSNASPSSPDSAALKAAREYRERVHRELAEKQLANPTTGEQES